jgi:outer membrane protein OmpA-like peptidoglycan-associated protein
MSLFRIDKRIVVQIILAGGLAGAAPHWAAGQALPGTCQALWAQLQAAAKARNLEAAKQANRKIQTGPGCNPVRVGAKGLMLGLHRQEDARLEKTGASPAERLAALRTALVKYGNDWDLRVRIADLNRQIPGASGQPDYAAVSQAYHDALEALQGPSRSARPSAAEVERVSMLAFQYEAVSPTLVKGRGLFTRDARQVFVGRTPVPLQFVYDSDELTDLGRAKAEQIAEELRKELKAAPGQRIHLVGHTDPKGSDIYNDKLSVRRAEAVKKFLIASGYPAGQITTDGRGKREVERFERKIRDRSQFTTEQIHQILRRVEIVWKQ